MKYAVAIGFLLFVSSLAVAQPEIDSDGVITRMGSGNTLLQGLEGCENTRTLPSSLNCFQSQGYVLGVSDLLRNLGLVKYPNGVTHGEIYDMVHLYLKNHPENRHYSAVSLIRKVLQEAWPAN